MQCSRNEGADKRDSSSSLFPAKSEHCGETSCPLPGVLEEDVCVFGSDVAKLVEEKDLIRKIWLQELVLFHFYSCWE